MATLDELTGGEATLDKLTTEEPGVGEKFLRGVAKSPEALLEGIKQIIAAARTPADPEQGMLSRFANFGKGMARGATLGMYQPEASTEAEGAQQQLGELVGGGRVFKGAVDLLKPLLRPALSATGLSSLVGALHGGVEGAGTGAGVGGLSELLMGGAKAVTKKAMGPGGQVLAVEEVNAQRRTENATMRTRELQELELRKVQNAELLNQHIQALRQAENQAQSTNQTAADAYRVAREAAELKLNSMQHDLSRAENDFAGLPKRVQGADPSTFYEPFNEAVQSGKAPMVALDSTSKIISRIGGGISKQTEGLPASAGPAGVAEKLAVGLVPETVPGGSKANLIAQLSPDIKAYLGETINTMSEQNIQKYIQADKISRTTGVPANDIVAVTEGNLNVGQVDRLLQVFGKQSQKSGVASEFFWGLMDDLKTAAKTDPISQSLLQARSAWRQRVASADIARMSAPGYTNTGTLVYNPQKVRAIFDPTNMKPEAVRLRESFPPDTQAQIVTTLEDVFHARQRVAAAREGVKDLRPPKMVRPRKVDMPDYMQEQIMPGKAIPEIAMEYRAPKGGLLRHPVVAGAALVSAINALFGTNIAFSIAGAGMAVIAKLAPDAIFRMSLGASRTQVGRAFLRNLFRNEPPNLNNPETLQALITFVGMEAMQASANSGRHALPTAAMTPGGMQ